MATEIGKVASLFRYPVKSMMGEELSEADVTQYGVLGDRTYALIDAAEGRAASAKNPGKWPTLFGCRAAFIEPPKKGTALPGVRITLHDGSMTSSPARDCDQILSKAFKRTVTMAMADRGWVSGVHGSMPVSWTGKAEEYWPNMDGRDHRDTVTEFTLPSGTFFDGAPIHLLTTATLDRLRELYPKGRFEAARFRPNLVIETPEGTEGFIEQSWTGKTVTIGEVQLSITGPCARCVMTTLAQGDLPKDSGILRTAVQHNQGHVGMYGKVVKAGTIRRSDKVKA
jgi:uncharacterized protein